VLNVDDPRICDDGRKRTPRSSSSPVEDTRSRAISGAALGCAGATLADMPEDACVRRVILYKRWLLRAHVHIGELAELVRDEIVPMYSRLSDDVALGLEHCADAQSVLAIQRWRSRRALESATDGPAFERWWSGYQPTLARWDALVEFDDEWEAVELIP
jgi:hypothetical protein